MTDKIREAIHTRRDSRTTLAARRMAGSQGFEWGRLTKRDQQHWMDLAQEAYESFLDTE